MMRAWLLLALLTAVAALPVSSDGGQPGSLHAHRRSDEPSFRRAEHVHSLAAVSALQQGNTSLVAISCSDASVSTVCQLCSSSTALTTTLGDTTKLGMVLDISVVKLPLFARLKNMLGAFLAISFGAQGTCLSITRLSSPMSIGNLVKMVSGFELSTLNLPAGFSSELFKQTLSLQSLSFQIPSAASGSATFDHFTLQFSLTAIPLVPNVLQIKDIVGTLDVAAKTASLSGDLSFLTTVCGSGKNVCPKDAPVPLRFTITPVSDDNPKQSVLTLRLGDEGGFSVADFINKLSNSADSTARLGLPSSFPNLDQVGVQMVELVPSGTGGFRNLSIVFTVGQVDLGHGFLLTDLDARVTVADPSASASSLGFRVDGQWMLGGINVSTTLSRTLEGVYTASAAAPSLPVGALIGQLGVALFPTGAVNEVIKAANLDAFAFLDVVASVQFAAGSQFLFRFTGATTLFPSATVTLIAGSTSTSPAAVLNINLGSMTFVELLQKLIPSIDLGPVDIFTSATAELTVASQTILLGANQPGWRIEGSIQTYEYRQGVVLATSGKLKSNCGSSEEFCNFVRTSLNDPTFVLQAGLTSSGLDIIAAVQNITLSKDLVLFQCGLHLVLSTDPSIGLLAKLILKVEDNKSLLFAGEIALGLGKLTFTAYMEGMWIEPFGIDVISIGNLYLSVGITVAAGLPSFVVAGELWVGRGCTLPKADCLKGVVQVGVDPVNPSGNFFAGSVNELTFESFLKAFLPNLAVSLPPVIAETGFPDGLNVSFSPVSRQLTATLPTIPAGFVLQGQLNFLGFLKVNTNIIIDPGAPSLLVNVSINPISIAKGVFVMQRSKSDATNGPSCYIDVRVGFAQVNASGYVAIPVLNIGMDASLTIGSGGYNLTVSVNLWLFKARVSVWGSYASVQTASLNFRADLEVIDFAEIVKNVMDQLSGWITQGQKQLTDAAADVAAKRKQWQDEANKLCSPSQCDVVCDLSVEGGDGATSLLAFADGRRVSVDQYITTLLHQHRRHFSDEELILLAEGQLPQTVRTKGWGAIGKAFTDVGKDIGDGVTTAVKTVGGVACTVGEVVVEPTCKGLCDGLKATVSGLAGTLKAAEGTLTGLSDTLGAVGEAADLLAKASGDWFQIHKASVSAALTTSFSKSSVNMSLSYSLLGRYKTQNFTCDLSSVGSVVNSILKKIEDSFSSIFPSSEESLETLIADLSLALPAAEEVEDVAELFDEDPHSRLDWVVDDTPLLPT